MSEYKDTCPRCGSKIHFVVGEEDHVYPHEKASRTTFKAEVIICRECGLFYKQGKVETIKRV